MAEPRTFRIRVTFGKTGRLAMLSHLELTHALERMVRRARLPFALSNGFSPHMKIAFGSALPVGIGGTSEIFDLTMTDYIAPAKVLEALQEVAAPDLMPTSCEYIEPRAKAASVAFPFSLYETRLDGCEDEASISYPAEIEVIRKKKPKILAVSDYLVGKPYLEDGSLFFQLRSTDNGNLRPDVFLKNFDGLGEILSLTRIRQSEGPIG